MIRKWKLVSEIWPSTCSIQTLNQLQPRHRFWFQNCGNWNGVRVKVWLLLLLFPHTQTLRSEGPPQIAGLYKQKTVSYQGFWYLIRATSHTRLRARDRPTSSVLIGGEGGAGPSSLPTTLERPTECISECKMDEESTWILMWHRMDRVSWSLGLFSKTASWRR